MFTTKWELWQFMAVLTSGFCPGLFENLFSLSTDRMVRRLLFWLSTAGAIGMTMSALDALGGVEDIHTFAGDLALIGAMSVSFQLGLVRGRHRFVALTAFRSPDGTRRIVIDTFLGPRHAVMLLTMTAMLFWPVHWAKRAEARQLRRQIAQNVEQPRGEMVSSDFLVGSVCLESDGVEGRLLIFPDPEFMPVHMRNAVFVLPVADESNWRKILSLQSATVRSQFLFRAFSPPDAKRHEGPTIFIDATRVEPVKL